MGTFFPFHTGGNHWALVVVQGGERKLEYYDSLLSKKTARQCLQVCCIFPLQSPSFKQL